jgi:hypothetical protein
MRALALLAAGLVWALPASAGIVSERPDSVGVTVYHSTDANPDDDEANVARLRDLDPREGLALITETRTIDIPAGPATIEFRGVASTIVPQTAQIDGLPSDVLEQNFDYDLLSPGSLLAKSVGNTVRVVRTNRATGQQSEQRAIIRSAPNGVVLDINGKFEALKCSGLPERLVFDRVPDGLRDTPTLSIRTIAPAAGRYTIRLSYIAVGINWAADYVARIRPDGKSLDLSAWITVANMGDTGFARTPLQVVAGRLQTTGEDVSVETKPVEVMSGCWPTNIQWYKEIKILRRLSSAMSMMRAPVESSDMLEAVVVTGSRSSRAAEDLGDYKLYRLSEPTDVLARQTKQVEFLYQQDVPFDRIYVFDPLKDADMAQNSGEGRARVLLRLQNTKAGGIGLPMPAGFVSVSETDAERPDVLIGRDAIKDTSIGLPIEIAAGKAMDVAVSWKVVETKTVGSKRDERERVTVEYVISNTKPVAIQFELQQGMQERLRIISESQSHAVKPEGFVWSISLAAGEQKTLRYTVEKT